MGRYSTNKECPLFGKKVTKGASFLLADYDDSLDDGDYDFSFAIYGSLMTTITADFRTNTGHVLNNISRGRLPDSWILLDNQSTVNIFWNVMFLVNVRTTTRRLNLQTNAGAAIITITNLMIIIIIMISLISSAMRVRPWVTTRPIKSAPYLGKR